MWDIVFKTPWTAPDTLMENCGNLLWVEPAIQILPDKLWNPEVQAVCSGEDPALTRPTAECRSPCALYRCVSPACEQQARAFLRGSHLLLGSFGKPRENLAVFYRTASSHAPREEKQSSSNHRTWQRFRGCQLVAWIPCHPRSCAQLSPAQCLSSLSQPQWQKPGWCTRGCRSSVGTDPTAHTALCPRGKHEQRHT